MRVPSPWTALETSPDLALVHLPIAERGRYYHRERTIVLRSDLSPAVQRTVLWHELIHARRGDARCHIDALGRRQEIRVHRLAAEAAMPWRALHVALRQSSSWEELVTHLEVEEAFVKHRLAGLHPAEAGHFYRWWRSRDYHP